jgi:hypothetical protein
MKRTLLSVLTVLFVSILLTGCGSDSKVDGGKTPAVEDTYTMTISDPIDSRIENGVITATFSVLAQNANGNPVSGLNLEKSVVVSWKLSSQYGTIIDSTPTSFVDLSQNYIASKVNAGDILLVFATPGHMDPSYLGDWKIAGVSDANTLTFRPEVLYNLEAMDGLSYVVGSPNTIVQGSPATVYIQNPVKQPGTSTSHPSNAEKGTTLFEVVYPEILAGANVCIGVHTTGIRSGTARCGIILPGASGSKNTDSNTSKSSK